LGFPAKYFAYRLEPDEREAPPLLDELLLLLLLRLGEEKDLEELPELLLLGLLYERLGLL